MEFCKLTICRQDVIVVSDTDAESKDVNSNKRKKHKRKTTYVRNVKMTTMTVNRIVPYCYRERCRSAQHYHRHTSMNTKYGKRNVSPIEARCKKSDLPTKNTVSKTDINDNDSQLVLTRDSYSPITVTSSDTYENVSSCSFNIQSSDSDELEDLINITRKRMKNDSGNFKNYSLRKSVRETTNQDDYQDISSVMFNNSIHSMDTVLLGQGDRLHSRSRSPEYQNQGNIKQEGHYGIESTLSCKRPNLNNNELLHPKIQNLTNENNNNLSPLYEISGKVFMEHYLNTSCV